MAAVTAIDWSHTWALLAGELAGYSRDGLQDLLTEDVVRFAALRILVAAGANPAQLRTEWRAAPSVAVDMAVGQPVTSAVEFKFPREPVETNAAWTQHLGELLKDFYRLAQLPAQVTDRWCVQVISERMRRYLDGIADRYGVRLAMVAGETTVLEPQVHQVLPATAARLLAPWADGFAVTARCTDVLTAGTGLRLVVHHVDATTASQPD